jgi:hypothetical protein
MILRSSSEQLRRLRTFSSSLHRQCLSGNVKSRFRSSRVSSLSLPSRRRSWLVFVHAEDFFIFYATNPSLAIGVVHVGERSFLDLDLARGVVRMGEGDLSNMVG